MAVAAPAEAASLSVSDTGGPNSVEYSAAPGEANDVSVRFADAHRVTVTDSGAVIKASALCDPVDEHRVTCETQGRMVAIQVRLADGDDSADVDADAPVLAAVLGYDGDDSLSVDGDVTGILQGDQGADRIVGGPGHDDAEGGHGPDAIDGGAGNDLVSGGSGNKRTRTSEADQLDGGEGDHDLVSYADHVGEVEVDLTAQRGGMPGATDGLAGFEGAYGSQQDDVLAGSPGADRLFGLEGDDVVGGADGDDALDGGTGSDGLLGDAGDDAVTGGVDDDTMFGGDGDDKIDATEGRAGARSDTAGCGSGGDVVRTAARPGAPSRQPDLLTADCEAVDAGLFAGVLEIPPRPLAGRRIRVGAGCPSRARTFCAVRLLATGGGQTLARGTRTVKNGTRRAIDGRLTRAGRQFVQGGGVATVRVRLRVAYTNRHGRRRAERAGFALLLPLE